MTKHGYLLYFTCNYQLGIVLFRSALLVAVLVVMNMKLDRAEVFI